MSSFLPSPRCTGSPRSGVIGTNPMCMSPEAAGASPGPIGHTLT